MNPVLRNVYILKNVYKHFQSTIASEDYKARITFTFMTDVSNNWMATLGCWTNVSNKILGTGNPGPYFQRGNTYSS